jgi:hypothetical protein
MLVCGVAYAMLLLGFRTKLAQILSFVCVLSLHTRGSFVGNGGDIVLGELALWTAFLPTGRRYSLDALIETERSLTPPNEAPTVPGARTPVVSVAVLGLCLQLAAIYLFNALNKTGTTWHEGSAVHYVLFHSGIVTPIGDWARGFMTFGLSKVLTYGAWGIEWLLPLLLLSPFAKLHARRLAVVLIFVLHTGFATFLNLGLFVPAMLAFAVHFAPAQDFDALERFFRRRGAPSFVRALVERAERVARFLARRPRLDPSETTRNLKPRLVALREGTAAVLVVLLLAQVLLDNAAITRVRRGREPELMNAAAQYLRFIQSWGMFAPDADKIDMNVFVDAVTVDGRHVDPFNRAASKNSPEPGPRIPSRLGQDALYDAYALRIASAPSYHQAFGEWILRYSERTGRERDRIVSFEAFEVTDEAPPPGGRVPGNTRVRSFLRFPER